MSKSEGLTMIKKISKRKMSMMLAALLFAASTSVVFAASDISGVTASGGVFNIDPAKTVSGIGFRDYENFKLDKGNTANLKFNGISKFVNMVDNQVNINGVVNTVNSQGNFTPGHAVFMSPKGVVVGADGVLNVGALSVYTPTASGMKMLKKGVNDGNLTTTYKGKEVDLLEAMGWHGNAPITINGEVRAVNDITMVANTLTIGNDGKVVAGANVSPDALFAELVRTKTSNNANVEFRTYNRPSGQMVIKGDVRNMGKGDIILTNRAANGINLSGNVYNADGQTHFVNNSGEFLYSGTVEGNGDSVYFTNAATAEQLNMSGGSVTGNAGIRILNKSQGGITLDANLVNKGKGLAITNEAGVLGIGGNINISNSDMNITNKGSQLSLNNIDATNSKIVISNKGNLGMQLNGTIKNNKSTAITNYNGAMTVNGTVQSTGGKLNLTNKGDGGLTLAQGSKILGAGQEVLVQNTGAGGFNANGTVQSSAKTYLQNTNGNMNIKGNIEESNSLVYVGNMRGNGKLTIDGNITGNNADIRAYNNGAGGMELNGTILNAKSTAVTNANGAMKVNGTVYNTAGKMNLTNKGAGGLILAESSVIKSDGGQVLVQNTGAGGFNAKGQINSSAKTYLQNTNGDMKIDSAVTGKNNLLYVGNVGNGGLTVNAKLSNENGKIRVYNKGAKGMTINADIENKNAGTALTNRAGNFALNANVNNQKGNINLTNVGNGSLTVAAGKTVSTTNGEIVVQNTATNGMNINGVVDTNKGNVVVYNKAGNLNLASTGKVKSESGNVYVSNAGNALNTQKGSEIVAKGTGTKLSILNTGNGGMNLNGTTRHSTGRTLITNRAGNLNLNGYVENSGGRVYVNNSGNGALKVTNNGGISNVGLGRTYLTNKGAGGMQIDGNVAGGGHVIATNRVGGMNITSKVTSTDANVVLTNTGNKNMNITGTVRGDKVTAKSVGNDIVLGNKETKQIAINGLKKVFITTKNGSIKNVGVDSHVIKSAGNLYMHADNGSIGEDVNTSGVGANSRDLTKSVNVVVDGRVKAFTTDKKNNSVINIASKGHDLNVDRIKADGKVILLTDKYTDENGVVHTGSILNDATELKNYANVKGTTVQMISSGSIGTAKKPLHFRQTDASQQSNVVAVKDVNLHARGKKDGEDVNFGVIKSKEGSIKANLIKDATIDNAIAAKKIDIKSRRNGNLKVKRTSHNVDLIKDYFD